MLSLEGKQCCSNHLDEILALAPSSLNMNHPSIRPLFSNQISEATFIHVLRPGTDTNACTISQVPVINKQSGNGSFARK